MSADEDTELRDLVAQTLEANGVLGKIRAQLRSSVFLALEEQESIRAKQPFVNKELKKFISTKEGRVVTSLVREFLEHFGLEFTLAVFDPETGFKDDYEGRESLSRELNITDSNEPPNGPLLARILNRPSDDNVGRTKLISSEYDSLKNADSETSFFKVPKDLSSQQIADARKKFSEYDKDHSGYIDKDELRSLFMDMFPHFHRNMLERYVNDEFRAVDRDFSSGIDFDEFLSMYKRLFVLCRSVVSNDVADIIPTSPARKVDSSHSKISSIGNKNSSNSITSPPSSVSVDSKNKRNLESEKSEHSSKHQPNGLLDIGSDPEDDPFFDDPLPKPTKTYSSSKDPCKMNSHVRNGDKTIRSSGSSYTSTASLAVSGSGTVGMSSLKELPALGEKSGSTSLGNLKDVPPLTGLESKKENGKPTELEKDIKAIDKRIADLGFDVPEDDDYDDDFITSSGISKLSARSEKSENKSMSIAEEIEEELDEDISGVDDLLKSSHSGFDDLTTDRSISVNSTTGFDYVEDVMTQ